MAVPRSLEPIAPTFGDRVRQGLNALRPVTISAHHEVLADVLSTRQAEAFTRLSRFDQAHLCRVYQFLRTHGEEDPDVLIAALLHDIGKVCEAGRVRLHHRVARVVLGRRYPKLLSRLAQLPAPRWRLGFALAVHHPELGAELAAALGCTPRVCWLIAHHEDDPPPDDKHLRRLVAADHAA